MGRHAGRAAARAVRSALLQRQGGQPPSAMYEGALAASRCKACARAVSRGAVGLQGAASGNAGVRCPPRSTCRKRWAAIAVGAAALLGSCWAAAGRCC
jgi:hypothetical protein